MKNTALVICFDDEADNEALRNPFKKKPQLRSQKPQKEGKQTPAISLATPVRQPSDKAKKHPEIVEPASAKQPLSKDEMRLDFFFDDEVKKTPASIAELFLAKKRLDQDSAAMSQHQAKEGAPKKLKSKEELAELRKQMMKKRVTSVSAQAIEQPGFLNIESPYGFNLMTDHQVKKPVDNLNYELMHRLAAGTKAKITDKEMKRLTKKNFEELPENKKKRDEERKRLEAAERQQRNKMYARELDERRREKLAGLKKKKDTDQFTLFTDRVLDSHRSGTKR